MNPSSFLSTSVFRAVYLIAPVYCFTGRVRAGAPSASGTAVTLATTYASSGAGLTCLSLSTSVSYFLLRGSHPSLCSLYAADGGPVWQRVALLHTLTAFYMGRSEDTWPRLACRSPSWSLSRCCHGHDASRLVALEMSVLHSEACRSAQAVAGGGVSAQSTVVAVATRFWKPAGGAWSGSHGKGGHASAVCPTAAPTR